MTRLHCSRGLAVILLLAARAAFAVCGDDPASATALAVARQTVAVACPCDGGSRAVYRRCVSETTRGLVIADQLPAGCARAVRRCAARSSCGRPGTVACCRPGRSGTTRCTITTAERCAAAGGCGGVFPSCCDACTTAGCATTTTTTTSSTTTTSTSTTTTTSFTTTTLPPGTCGDGVINPGEWCDGEEFCASNCAINRVACCSITTPSSAQCSKDVPAYTLTVYQQTVCPLASGGTFMLGKVSSGGASCPDSPAAFGPSSQGACVSPPPLAAPATVCCASRSAPGCTEITTASQEALTTFVWSCLYANYPSAPVLAGTCGSNGACVPAH